MPANTPTLFTVIVSLNDPAVVQSPGSGATTVEYSWVNVFPERVTRRCSGTADDPAATCTLKWVVADPVPLASTVAAKARQWVPLWKKSRRIQLSESCSTMIP